MKFATDSKGNLYLYFKTFRHVESWPDNSFTATLWIYSFNRWNANSRQVDHMLDGIYGTFTSTQDDFLNDRSIGHLVFDNTGNLQNSSLFPLPILRQMSLTTLSVKKLIGWTGQTDHLM